MYELKIFLVNLESGPKKILAIIIGFDLEESIKKAESLYQNAEFVDVGKIISWQEFKSFYDTETWPEKFRENDSGLFDLEVFYEVSHFVRNIVNELLERKLNFKIEICPN